MPSVPGMRPLGAWRGSFYALYINFMFKIVYNFSNIDKNFVIEAFKACIGPLVPGKRPFCLERVFLRLVH